MRDLQTRLCRIAGKYFAVIVLCSALAVTVPANGKTPPGKGTGKPPGKGTGKTLAVTTNADDASNKHSLRYALAKANDGDKIQLTAAVKGPIVLKNGELVVNKNVTILSVPARIPTISGDNISRIFMIAEGATVTLQRLNLISGNGSDDNSGENEYDGTGGAILNLGTLNVTNCIISDNSAPNDYDGTAPEYPGLGGAIANFGALTITNSTISENSANDRGGGIYNNGTSLIVTGCSFSFNEASTEGGGIYDYNGTLSVGTSSFESNSPDNIFEAGSPYEDLGGNTGLF